MELKRQLPEASADRNIDQFLGRLFDHQVNGALLRASARQQEQDRRLFNAGRQLLSLSTPVDDLPNTRRPETIPNAASD